jgi:sugar phosphate isomerase/epimerase
MMSATVSKPSPIEPSPPDPQREQAVTESAAKLAAAAVEPLADHARLVGSSMTGILGQMLENNERRYAGLIDFARGTVVSARALEAERYVDGPEAVPIDPVREEVTRVAGIVASMAEATTSLLEVARDSQAGQIRLEASAAATRYETERLRAVLESGQRTAEKAEGRLFWATVAIGALTAVLIVLTAVLVVRPA